MTGGRNGNRIFWDARTFWHAGGNYAMTLPQGGLVQPLAPSELPESPETKRRLKNLMDVTASNLDIRRAAPAKREEVLRVHPAAYRDALKPTSDAGEGELGHQAPFAKDGGALSRPPDHHWEPNTPTGFCLLANIAIAAEAAHAQGRITRAVVPDWNVHHGNGTEIISYDRDDALTIALHQEGNYPFAIGALDERGMGAGIGVGMGFNPEITIVSCGYDYAMPDPLGSMLASAQPFRDRSAAIKVTAAEVCNSTLVAVREGGYSGVYVPFCGHTVMEVLSASDIIAPDPMADILHLRQPNAHITAFRRELSDDMAAELGL